MKHILFILGFIITFGVSYSQPFTNRGSAAVTNVDQRLKAGLNFYLPVTTDTTLNGGLDSLGALLLVIKSGDTSLYMRIPRAGGNKWAKMLRSGDAAGGVLTFNTRTGNVTLSISDVTTALGYTPPNPNGTNLQYIAGDGSKVTFPTIPAQFNPIAGYGISITGTYPNKTFTADTSVLFPAVRATISGGGGVGISSLNGLTAATQTFATGTSGSDFGISSASTTHTFNLPIVSGTNTGKVTPSLFNTWNAKISNITGLVTAGTNVTVTGSGTSGSPYVINAPSGKNADSIKKLPVDTSTNRNNYVLTFDSANHKWILTAPGSGGGGSGTVTQVNTGYGLSGGPITTTGTLLLDSATLYLTALRRKDSTLYFPKYRGDTLATNVYNALNGKQPAGNYITALTGDVVATGPGSVAATIQANAVTTTKINNNAVTYAKIQAASGQALLGATGAGNYGEITLGTNLSMTGSVLNATSGGGSQTLQQVLTTGSALTTPNTITTVSPLLLTGNKFVPDSIHIGVIANHLDSLGGQGTSITAGVGPTDPAYIYLTKTAQRLNAIPANYGHSGASLLTAYPTAFAELPIYSVSLWRGFIFEWGVNDIQLGVSDSTNFSNMYKRVIDTMTIARGWPTWAMRMLLPSYINPGLSDSSTLVRQLKFRNAVIAVAAAKGITTVDPFSIEIAYGPDLMLADLIHPNNDGSNIAYTDPIAKSFGDTVRSKAQALAINGISEFQKITFKGTDTSNYSAQVLGRDSTNKVVTYPRNAVIMNSTLFPAAQAANIWANRARFGTTDQSGVEIVKANGVIAGLGLRAIGSLPGGMTGQGVEVSLQGSEGWIDTYDRTGGFALPLRLSPFNSAPVLIGGDAATGSATLQVAGRIRLTAADSATIDTTRIVFWDRTTLTFKTGKLSGTGGGGGGSQNLDQVLTVGNTSTLTPTIQTPSVNTEVHGLDINFSGNTGYQASVVGSFSGTLTNNYLGLNVKYAGAESQLMKLSSDSLVNLYGYLIMDNNFGSNLPAGVTRPRHEIDLNGLGAKMGSTVAMGTQNAADFYNTITNTFVSGTPSGNKMVFGLAVGDNVSANNIDVLKLSGDGAIKIYPPASGSTTDSVLLYHPADSSIRKIAVSSIAGGSDTLKLVTAGTPGARLLYAGHDTLFAKAIGNATTLTDSTIQVNTLENADQTLVANRNILGATFNLNIGTTGSKISSLRGNVTNSFGFTSDGGAGSFLDQGSTGTLTIGNTAAPTLIKGGLELSSILTATDANASTIYNAGVILPDITANRTLQLSGSVGKLFIVMNRNTTGFTWSTTGFTIKDSGGNTITNLVNGTTYILYSDGTNFIKIN